MGKPSGDRRIADPFGLPVGLVDAVTDRLAVGPRGVSRPGGSPRTTLPPVLLGKLDRRLPIGPQFCPAPGLRLPGLEQVGRQLGTEPRTENLLGRGAKVDSPFLPVVLRLVTLRGEDPN